MPLRATWGVLYFVFAEAAKALACDFEIACSMFTNVGTDTFNWNRASGRTPSTGTGPNAAAHGSYYMFIETSFPRVEGDFADLNASSLTLLGPTVLTFQYHMYGATMGKLQVLVNGIKFWEKSGNQGNAWKTAKVYLPQFATGIAVNVTFRGIRGSAWRSDLAIDDIKFEQAGCDFETTCSLVTNVVADTFNWSRTSGGTPSIGTGPGAAAQGNYYMFIEASRPRIPGDYADLTASSLTLNGPTVLRFQYHMYGATMGKLQVLVNRTKFWERSGNQGNGWNTANVFLTQFATGAAVEVTFRGIRGQGWQSDLAIDNIKFEQALTSAALTPAPKPAPAPTLAPRLAPMPTPAPMPEPTPAPSLVLP